jgi:hypothetical protein
MQKWDKLGAVIFTFAAMIILVRLISMDASFRAAHLVRPGGECGLRRSAPQLYGDRRR